MTNKFFLALNGPARSGKDTLAKFITQDKWFASTFTVQTVSFTKIIKSLVHRFIDENYDETLKDEVMSFSRTGKTYRQGYISFSEDFAKPTFGQDVFGRIVARRIEDDYVPNWAPPRLYVCTDSGFQLEYNAVVELLGPSHCIVVQLHREGHDFLGDSRSYWSDDVKAADIYNNASLEEFKLNAVSVLRQLVMARGWDVPKISGE